MNDKISKACELFQNGSSLSDIAKQLDVSPATVRSWKSRGKLGDVATKRNVAKKRCNTKPVAEMIQSVESNEELTDQERAFCLHYAKTFHATNSAIRAGYSSKTAGQIGYQLLQKTSIRNEITRLKQIRSEAILAGPDDIVEKYMHIAFADITDYLEFGRTEVPVMAAYGPVQVKDPKMHKKVTLMKKVNDVRFKESSEVDGTLLSEVKQGKDGASVKLADRMKALEWLGNYFSMNPMDKHRIEFENKKLELEKQKVDSDKPPQAVEDDPITVSLKEELQK